MTHQHRWGIFALALAFILTGFTVGGHSTDAQAQQPTPQSSPNVVITYPPAVYVVRGSVEVRGTVNLPNLSTYFLEFRSLDPATLQPFDENEPWLPATLPQTGAVIDNVITTWDTLTVADGLYQLRLVANVSRQGPTAFVVQPIRVENDIPPFLQIETPVAEPTSPTIIGQPTATTGGIVIVRPTLAATPTSLASTNPIATANVDANVRSGDDQNKYPVIGALPAGFTADVLGISSSGSGWYYIELGNGRRGFISPSTITITGNISNLQRINPPPPPATATPTPLPFTGDAVADGIGVVPAAPTCNVPFDVQVNITNAGAQAFGSGAVVQVRIQRVSDGAIVATGFGNFPALSQGQNYVAVVPFSLNATSGVQYRALATADINNNIIESNEGNNSFTGNAFTLGGACP